MNTLKKYLFIGFLTLISTTFLPTQTLQAQIFGGTTTDNNIPYGICLDEDAKVNPNHPHYQDCQGVNCDQPQNEEELIKCTSEAEAGTTLAGESLSPTGLTHTNNFGDFIKKLVNFSLPYLTLAAFVGYVVAGFMYVTAFGNDDQIGKAKNILLWSSIGLVLVIMSYAITQLLTTGLVNDLQDSATNPLQNPNNSLKN